ncbi:MAG: hypothetical protein CME59_16170 [Halioglobus sp.]|nr:hypothetical protein [Halioglobus sp.]
MSEKLINHNPDLKKLRDSGADMEIRGDFLILHGVPYVTSQGTIAHAALVTDLQQNGDTVPPPRSHQVWFTGDYPCDKNGNPIEAIRHSSNNQPLCDGIVAKHHFSCKPKGGYPDYYEKMTRYADIISHPARALDDRLTPYPHKPIRATDEESIFHYPDTASSRYGITGLSEKCSMNKVVIVGLGGTGSYILDLIAKTPIREIHLIDGDRFSQHNAFRAPGAPSLEELEKMPPKVAYYASRYGKMHRGITPHAVYLDDETLRLLDGADFVFLCVDKPAVRKLAFAHLIAQGIPFIDTGMGLEYIEEDTCLIGDCRATLCTPAQHDHLARRVSTADTAADDIYDSNIQVADMNMLNAAFAVMKWKKYCGFYQDIYKEHNTTYSINSHHVTRDETTLKAIK